MVLMAVLLQKSLNAPDPQIVEDAWNTFVQRGRYEPIFYGQLIASCPLSFDASVLVLNFGNAGMIREVILLGIMMDTQPIPILHPGGCWGYNWFHYVSCVVLAMKCFYSGCISILFVC
ncbi:hypothetical protein HN51_021729 [Arachis hypogaea]